MLRIKTILFSLPEFEEFGRLLESKNPLQVKGLSGSSKAVAISLAREVLQTPLLIVVPTADEAEKLTDDLRMFVPEDRVSFFPAEEVVPFDRGLFTPAMRSMRLHALVDILIRKNPIVVTLPQAILRRVPHPAEIQKNIVTLNIGEQFERDLLIDWLASAGYERVHTIEEIGQFSVRGGIVDVFSFESDAPYRIEFFDDEIESIREFDVLSQLSIQKVDSIRILGSPPEVQENASLLDFIPKNSAIFWENWELCQHNLKDWWEQAQDKFHKVKEEMSISSIEEFYVPLGYIQKEIQGRKQIQHHQLLPADQADMDFRISPPTAFHGNMKLFVEHLNRRFSSVNPRSNWHIYLLYEGEQSRSRLEEILEAEMGYLPPVQFVEGEFYQGFILPQHQIEILTDHEIFNRIKIRRRKRRIRISGSLIRNLQSLQYGDYVVHMDYGIGKYVGTERIKVAGSEKECIKLIYEDNDVLYVNLDKLNHIQKFVGEEGIQPRLTRLGSTEWERVKKRTRKAVEKIAKELVQLYARRMSEKGYVFSADTLWQKELEASFPFEDTIDQRRVTEEVKKDMESAKPMDRLICGDVGYGKTEIAVRAAFKAVMDGKQVAVLVPTTILAHQHFHTFRERMANFPVNIEVISRFLTPGQQKTILQRLSSGDVDIIIGTHRLLSSDVKFKDLGLLIVDEEQRFGVRQKEKLKAIKVTVDTLSMTATPIPRTLHMALMGARDLSNVDTPPGNRHPIITEITTWDTELIYKAITYEISRGGQVFFVHNRVQTIDGVAGLLKNIVPKARIAVAHGQMRERQLEKIMEDFYHQKYDVLVATMIIENGLDIPNCNTIIINRADQFGLAQLYQLRGRVGRSDRQAYAYLIVPPQDRMNESAIKRLYALEEFSELGSGLKIAMRDLEIRGAGNLLGHQQSGFINAVGYDLYQKILQETVESIQQETLPAEFIESRMPMVDASVDVDVDIYLPEEYIPSPNEKVMIYHRLLNLDNLHLIENLANELKDRFGPLPPPAEALIEMVKIKKLASRLYIKQVKIQQGKMTLIFDERATSRDQFIEKELPKYVNQDMAPLKFIQNKDLRAVIVLKGQNPLDRMRFAKKFLLNLS